MLCLKFSCRSGFLGERETLIPVARNWFMDTSVFWGAVGTTAAVLVVLFCVKVFVVASVARISDLQSLFEALV